MAALLLLDTNVMIAALKGQARARRRLDETPSERLRLSAIVLGELEFGVEKSRLGDRNRTLYAALLNRIPILTVDREVAQRYGRLRADLERQGMPIGSNDLWIAAQALAAGAVLVTDNEREFARVPELQMENWLRD